MAWTDAARKAAAEARRRNGIGKNAKRSYKVSLVGTTPHSVSIHPTFLFNAPGTQQTRFPSPTSIRYRTVAPKVKADPIRAARREALYGPSGQVFTSRASRRERLTGALPKHSNASNLSAAQMMKKFKRK